MASFAEILAKKPKVQTRQALMVIGLQNDFITPSGHLPVDTTSGFLDRIHSLIPRLRELDGTIIWVQSIYEADRVTSNSNIREGEGDALVIAGLVNGEESGSQVGDDESVRDQPASLPQPQSRSEKHKQRVLNLFKSRASRKKALPVEEAKVIIEEDEELFLLKRSKKDAACMPDSEGASFIKDIKGQIETPRDALIRTTNYSAFLGTNLLLTLRARLITEIYVCGCLSNVNVLATVIDGVRHGIKINVIRDALGFRMQVRHELALNRMEDFFDAYMVTTADVLAKEHFAVIEPLKEEPKPEKRDPKKAKDELEALIGNMSLNEKADVEVPPANGKSATATNGQVPSTQAASPRAQEILAADDMAGEEDLEAIIVRPRRTNGAEQPPAIFGESSLVQSRPRMRKKKKKKKQTEGSSAEPGASNGDWEKTPSNSAAEPGTTTSTQPQAIAMNECTKGGSAEETDGTATGPPAVKFPETTTSNNISSVDKAPTKMPPDESTTESTAPKGQPSSAQTLLTTDSSAPSPDNYAIARTIAPSLSQNNIMDKPSKIKSLVNLPVRGPGDHIAEGDSRIVHNIIPLDYRHPSDPSKSLADTIFQELYGEVRWQKMLHQQGEVPRLVCCQGEFRDDGSKPVYRHPADQTLPLLHFSPKVQWIRRQTEKLVGHPLNHVLIQLYRNGNDYISEHSDKTLDIAKGSTIVNVSFGAQRTMRLRTKRDSKADPSSDEDTQRETQRVALPHNSMFVLGLQSNEKWLHGIMADKRLPAERSDLETAHSGARISLTFRHIATFLDAKETVIWGQGATSKDQRGAADVVNNDNAEAERMIRAFGRENHSNAFEWEEWYGEGFDVLHLHEPPGQLPILFAANSARETKQIQLGLWEAKINHTLLEAPGLDQKLGAGQKVMFRDNDTYCTEVAGLEAILHYLDRYYSFCDERSVTARAYTLLEQNARVSDRLFDRRASIAAPALEHSDIETTGGLSTTLHVLSEQLKDHGGPFIAGKRFSVADCVIWPLLDECVEHSGKWDESEWPELAEYYRATWRKKACLKKLRAELPLGKKA